MKAGKNQNYISCWRYFVLYGVVLYGVVSCHVMSCQLDSLVLMPVLDFKQNQMNWPNE